MPKDKLLDQNNKTYFLKTSYLHITFHRDIWISLMNKLFSTNSNYQDVLLYIQLKIFIFSCLTLPQKINNGKFSEVKKISLSSPCIQ